MVIAVILSVATAPIAGELMDTAAYTSVDKNDLVLLCEQGLK